MNIVAVDIGNTHIVLGYFRGKQLVHSWRLVSDVDRTVDEYSLNVRALFEGTLSGGAKISSIPIDKVIICCVVPSLARVFDKLFQKYFNIQAQVVSAENIPEILVETDSPATVGADRVVNAFAAREIYGAPGIVVDFGTATTFDIISSAGSYYGGVIAPGLIAATEALTTKAALLPSIEIAAPKHIIGKNTHDSMLSGIVYGYASLVDGLVERIQSELESRAVVIGTGGLVRLMSPYTASIEEVAPELTLEGLRRLAR